MRGLPKGVWFIKYEVERMEVDEMTGPLRDNFQNELDMSNNLFSFLDRLLSARLEI